MWKFKIKLNVSILNMLSKKATQKYIAKPNFKIYMSWMITKCLKFVYAYISVVLQSYIWPYKEDDNPIHSGS